MVREGLAKKVTFEQRPKEGGGYLEHSTEGTASAKGLRIAGLE